MSKVLYWEPVVPPERKTLPYNLKHPLAKVFGVFDGSCYEEFILSDVSLPVIHALAKTQSRDHRAIEPAWQELIDLIETHKVIRLVIDE